MTGILQSLLASRGPGPAFLSSSFAQQTANDLTIAKPASVISGTLLIAVMATDFGGLGIARLWSGDSGWTERTDENGQPNLRIATKVAGGAEPANYTFTPESTPPAATIGGYILAFERATYDNIGSIGTSTGINNCIAGSTTFSTLNGLMLAFFAKNAASATFTTPAGMTSLLTDSDVTSPSFAIFSQFANIGATGTRTATPSAGGDNAGVLLGLI